MTRRDLIPVDKKKDDSLFPLAAMRQQMDDVFDRFLRNWDVFPSSPSYTLSSLSPVPSLDVSETDKDVCIKAELPGMEQQDVKIEVNQNQLTLRGEKRSEKEDKDESYWMKEIAYGNFSRTLTLPFDIDPDKAKASFSKGILTLTIEKPHEAVSPKKTIPITG